MTLKSIPERNVLGASQVMRTYADGKLILQPLQVEVQVGLGHLLLTPAGELRENSRRHVDDEAVGAVQEGQERSPDVLLALRGVVQEDLDTRAILLKRFPLIVITG